MKRILSIVISALMLLALVPAAALAEDAAYAVREAAAMRRWDDVWSALDPVEKEMLALGATPAEVTNAVYKAALNCPLIDEGSITDLCSNEFTFTTAGMLGGYNYRVRNYDKAPARMTAPSSAAKSVERINAVKNGPSSINVLLVGPYYGSDSNFTDQYRREAQSLAEATGGQLTVLQGSQATGPNIAANYPNKGIVIYDSHGNCISSKQTSYLDLTSSTGLTSTDYSNGWAYNGGSFYGIDGRYIQNHVTEPLSNCFVWMAICEGMKLGGRGTTGTALLAAGAAAVYGYSQSVTFAGDYEYEATFWDLMKEGAVVSEALEEMKEVHGIPDPYGDAYPILMSPVDPFPSNPDGAQEVSCDWNMYSSEPVALESYSLSDTALDVYEGFTKVVTFDRVPFDANAYELIWSSADESVAAVAGNNRKVRITGVSEGATEIVCTVLVGGSVIGTESVSVNVLRLPTLNEAANAPGGSLEFTSATAAYPWTVGVVDGMPAAMSGNAGVNNSTSTLQLAVHMEAGDQLTFRMKASSEDDYDFLRFYVNNSMYGSQMSGESEWREVTYTAQTSGSFTFQWRFVKDQYVGSYDDCGYICGVRLISSVVPGDVNYDSAADSADALLVLRYSMGLEELTADQLARADVNGDGAVDSADALRILRDYLLG
ncbi:MAG: Ig-like domain-containing protein [Clostridia bacterium]|nr:Ig-like domain-containing protein [Clostridia bacterium]